LSLFGARSPPGHVSQQRARVNPSGDAGGSVKDLLIDVSGSRDDFELPAEAPAQLIGDLLAMLEVPQAAREAVRSL
jgi:hypothetical protein